MFRQAIVPKTSKERRQTTVQSPTVAILLATYNPPVHWLGELLDSLNAQSYPNLCLYVRDDASTSISMRELDEILRKHITAFPYKLLQNEQNLGSNGTFEALVRDCNEPYIAFCDQDDVWNPDKIENTLSLLQSSPLHPVTVCTNVSVIDGDGNPIADRMEHHRKRHVFLRGEGLAPELIHRNFALGCTMIMERERLLSYLPFPKEIVHDHYITFCAACDGAIDYLDEPQMRYRVYGGNQTVVMAGVRTKEDYLARRILTFDQRIKHMSRVASLPALKEASEWSRARLMNFHREKGGFRALWKTRHTDPKTSLLELLILRLPTPLFRFVISLIQKGVL